MPKGASFGVFPSQSAVRSKSTSDIQRLYFKTSQKDEFDWRTLPENDRAENFDQVHNIGKRTTKYMKYQKKVAPLVDRTACRYNMEFIPKPSADYMCNKELAETFAGVKSVSASPSFGVQSNYKETFVPISTEKLRGAKQKSQAPKQVRTKTLGGTDDLLETESMLHRTYSAPDIQLAKPTPALIPKPNLTMSGHGAGEMFRSNYDRSFANSTARIAPERPFEVEPSPHVLADDSIYRTRRACFLSPGA
eukprot:TRINITY_DN55142_c0_g1_i1.p1 TRINITY_DN55142_c0_g1~~TRINITY_DN55142_c0_g1_i1.p1  ORF type:complete len:249 (-),score=43.60 TRINITY_DN55142_c0_g1_i1:63-809(-)